jgi:hypothetical protein
MTNASKQIVLQRYSFLLELFGFIGIRTTADFFFKISAKIFGSKFIAFTFGLSNN